MKFTLLISFNINANLIIKKKVSKFESCKQIMNTGNANGDGIYTIYPNGINGNSEEAYCDMTLHGGGWQLVSVIAKTSIPNTLQTESEYPTELNSIGDINNPTTAYMFKGDLSRFNNARESVDCSTKNSCSYAFGSNLTTSELNTIRFLQGSASRLSMTQGQVPNCTNNYSNFISGINDRPYCDNNQRSPSSQVTTVSGWQVDIHGTPYCWLMRSSSFRSTNKGSGLCQSSGEPNGSRYSMLWMR